MRVYILQHEDNEWIGSMQTWFANKGYELTTGLIYQDSKLPELDSFDWLVIMGGSMSLYEEERYAWFKAEKQFIRAAIEADKKVLGICLGGQLIANAMGAKVVANDQAEIGWYPLEKLHPCATWLPEDMQPLSWHGDRFELPENAIAFARSQATPCQGFCLSDKVWALQFHLEASVQSVKDFYQIAGQKLPDGECVQSYEQLLAGAQVTNSEEIMHRLLDFIDHAK